MRRLFCRLFHKVRVLTAYSNRTHRWKCDTCGQEWDD